MLPVPPRRRRWGLLLAVALVALAIGWIAFSGIGNALVYYVTPTELLSRGDPHGQTVRLGGQVKAGSIVRGSDRLTGPQDQLTFVLTDGTTEIIVIASGGALPTSSFREGSGAVVEGQLNAGGIFEAQQVIVKHDENYVAPSEGTLPSQVIDPGS
jgi:cytochrome c-type biogenesis protein CcmE